MKIPKAVPKLAGKVVRLVGVFAGPALYVAAKDAGTKWKERYKQRREQRAARQTR